MRCFLISTLFVSVAIASPAENCDQPGRVPCDIWIGKPIATPFTRAFPLLDGLYQDLSAMQVTPLSVSPNGPNAASLDAVIQQFQASLQSNAGLGVQNSVAAQQAATATANIALQNSMIAYEQQLYSQLQTANQDQLAKHDALNALASNDPTLPAAQAAATAADNQVTQLQNQLTSLQKLISITAPSSTSFSSPVPNASGSSTVPVPSIQSVTSPAPVVGPTPTNFAPSFPAYKQLEVQAALLRERLAKLVSVLSQQSHFADSNLYLLEFHVSPMAPKPRFRHNQRKGKMLNVEYAVQSCGTVVDLFPRNSAVNISNEKYRDSRWGINFILSLFSFGLNSAYNREHLQISQSLSQAAYITGFGITESRFGWSYGLALGEDSLAPGDRETFALIAVPKKCSNAPPAVALSKASWDQDPPSNAAVSANALVDGDGKPVSVQLPKIDPASASGLTLNEVSYSPVQYDPTSTTSKPVAVVNFTFAGSSQIDSEATLTANGVPIKRARDNFFRGTSVPSGTTTFTGLLEDSTFEMNTWIPLGPNQIAVSLDATALSTSGSFPRIVMSVPGQAPLDLTAQIKNDPAFTVSVAGRPLRCSDLPCAPLLPPLGLPKPSGTSKTITASRMWDKGQTDISITVDDSSTQPQAVPSGVQVGQLIAASEAQKWGTPVVLAEGQMPTPASTSSTPAAPQPPGTTPLPQPSAPASPVPPPTKTVYALHCSASGGKLDCALPDGLAAASALTITVTDVNYSGSAVFGSADLGACDPKTNCYLPLPRHVEDPVWDATNGGKWLLRMSLDNIGAGELDLYDTFDPSRNKRLSTSKLHCNASGSSRSCDAVFEITPDKFPSLTDDMSIGFVPQGTTATDQSPVGSARLFLLRTLVQPVLAQFKASTDHTSISVSGKNLFFDNIRIGSSKSGTQLSTDCPAAVACSVTGGSKDLSGYVYFCADSACKTVFPLLLADDKGVLSPAWLDKVAANPGNGAAPAPPAPPPPSPSAPAPNPALNLKNAAGNAVNNLENAAGTLRLLLNRHVLAGQNK